MVTVNFQPEEKHINSEWWGLFAEAWDGKSENYHVGHNWQFELEETDIREIKHLCKKYSVEELETEACCILYRMKHMVKEKTRRFNKEQWDIVKEPLDNLEKWFQSSLFNNIFEIENIEYTKVKQRNAELAIRYDGDLLRFICQTIVEKYERDREVIQLLQIFARRMIHEIKEFKSTNLRERPREEETFLAYHIFKFLEQESPLSISDIERFSAELMKLAGFYLPPDSSDPTANADNYMKNVSKWRKTYEKFLVDHGLKTDYQ